MKSINLEQEQKGAAEIISLVMKIYLSVGRQVSERLTDRQRADIVARLVAMHEAEAEAINTFNEDNPEAAIGNIRHFLLLDAILRGKPTINDIKPS